MTRPWPEHRVAFAKAVIDYEEIIVFGELVLVDNVEAAFLRRAAEPIAV